MSTATPVSATLQRELSSYVRDQGLVVWLDADKTYSDFVDHLSDNGFPYAVTAFRGSFLELMLALEPHCNGLRADNVLVHMPGFNTTNIIDTPLLELYRAGKSFQKNLGTLVAEAAHGHALPEEIAAFIRNPALSLSSADTWIGTPRTSTSSTTDALAIYLQGRGTNGIVADLVGRDERLPKLLGDADVDAEPASRFREHLRRTLGVTPAWESLRLPNKTAQTLDDFLDLALSWLMAVEFVTDLNEPPVVQALKPLSALPAPLVKECRALVADVRERYPEQYRILSIDVESTLTDDRTGHHARALGSIDTFAFEEHTIRGAALSALEKGDWNTAKVYAVE